MPESISASIDNYSPERGITRLDIVLSPPDPLFARTEPVVSLHPQYIGDRRYVEITCRHQGRLSMKEFKAGGIGGWGFKAEDLQQCAADARYIMTDPAVLQRVSALYEQLYAREGEQQKVL